MVTESERRKGFVPIRLVHRWTCLGCNFKYYFDMNTKSDADRVKLTKIEAEISIHVMKTHHEVTHKEAEPFRIRRI